GCPARRRRLRRDRRRDRGEPRPEGEEALTPVRARSVSEGCSQPSLTLRARTEPSPMHWTQNYDPLGSPLLSTLVAALPIVLLLGLLATGRVSAPRAAFVGLLAAVGFAIGTFRPPETWSSESGGVGAWAGTVLAAAGHGAAFGLLPIGWIVLAAIFLYALT